MDGPPQPWLLALTSHLHTAIDSLHSRLREVNSDGDGDGDGDVVMMVNG